MQRFHNTTRTANQGLLEIEVIYIYNIYIYIYMNFSSRPSSNLVPVLVTILHRHHLQPSLWTATLQLASPHSGRNASTLMQRTRTQAHRSTNHAGFRLNTDKHETAFVAQPWVSKGGCKSWPAAPARPQGPAEDSAASTEAIRLV